MSELPTIWWRSQRSRHASNSFQQGCKPLSVPIGAETEVRTAYCQILIATSFISMMVV